MPISVTCACGKTIQAKDELAGRRVRCPQCGQPLAVPGGRTAPRTGPPAGSGSIHDLSSGSYDLGSLAGMQQSGNPLGDPMGMPGMGAPGGGMPGMGMGQAGFGQDPLGGMGMPGMGAPGMGMPGMGMPGMGSPGMGMPGMGMPGAGFQQSGSRGGGGSNTLLYVLMGLGGFTVFVLLCFVVVSMFIGDDPVATVEPTTTTATTTPTTVATVATPGATTPAAGTTTPAASATTPAAGTAATGASATATPVAGASGTGAPATGTPATGTPATGTPAAGTPAAGTPATGTPAAGTPMPGAVASAGTAPAATTEASSTTTPAQGPPLLALNDGLTKWRGGPGPHKGMREFERYRRAFCWSWMTELLPHLGHQAEYDKIDFTKSWAEVDKPTLPLLEIPAFLSPGDTRTKWEGYPFDGMALTHFVGMAGAGDSRTVSVPELPRTDSAAGVFGYEEIMKWDDITDGTSQTIAVIGAGALVAPWICGGGATVRGAHQPYFDKDRGFGSRGLEPAGTYVLFADGSVRVLPPDIDAKVFRSMCTGHGGDSVDVSNIGTSLTIAAP